MFRYCRTRAIAAALMTTAIKPNRDALSFFSGVALVKSACCVFTRAALSWPRPSWFVAGAVSLD